MIKISVLVGAGLSAFISMTGFAAQHSYTIESYPDVANCHENARVLGESFAVQSGAQVILSRCTNIGSSGQSIEIVYNADAPVAFLTTDQSGGSIDSRGFFRNSAACNAALVTEKAFFESETRLPAFVSYCYPSQYLSEFRWVMRIDGLGTSQKKPSQEFITLFGALRDSDREQTLADIKQSVIALGGDVRLIDVRTSIGITEIGIFYYANDEVYFTSAELGEYVDQASCESEAQYSLSILNEENSNILALCLGDFNHGPKLVHLTIGQPSVSYVTLAEFFSSYADCLSKKEETLEIYRGPLNRNVLGGTCGRTVNMAQNFWRIFLFER